MSIQQCRSCGAPVIWLQHIKTGKPAPIDAEPSPVGNIYIGATYMIVPAGRRGEYPGQLHTNHFMTCPHAKTWARSGYHSDKSKKDQAQ